MDAARERGDIEMISKLANYEDLFAHDAMYHKLCYSIYISQKNVSACRKKTQKTDEDLQKEEPYLSNSDSSDSNDNNIFKSNFFSKIQVLHEAASLLRKEMSEFELINRGFPTPEVMNRQTFQSQVPNVLLLFISWLIDANVYEKVSNTAITLIYSMLFYLFRQMIV